MSIDISLFQRGTVTFAKLWAWTCDPAHQWRSWAAHTLLVIGIALLFGVLVAVFCYSFREVEQALVYLFVLG